MKIEQDVREKNFILFQKKVSGLGFDPTALLEKIGTTLKDASFSTTNELGIATEGSLIEIVLKILTPYAVRINELLPESIRVDKTSLVKVCLLQHISKAVRFIPNDNQWEVEHRKMVYKYEPSLPLAVGTGLHSLILASQCGITFTDEEAEAMTILDRDLADKQAKFYCSTLSSIIRQANDLVYLQLSKENKI